jgi:uncharacterized delta-60 repeat protein
LAGDFTPPNYALAGPAKPRRSVCAPTAEAFSFYRRPILERGDILALFSWMSTASAATGVGLTRPKASRPKPSRFRPRLEALEDRFVPSGGVLDPTFGSGGLVSATVGAFNNAYAVATYPAGSANAGKVVAVGTATVTKRTNTYNEFAVVRYNLDGSLDTSFGGTGEVTTIVTSVQQGGWARDVAIQQDGKVVVAGEAFPGFALVRYNADGSLDTSFGSQGTGVLVTSIGKHTSDEAYRLGLQTDGNIVVAGTTNSTNLALVRFTSSGALDSSFGTDGKVTTQFSSPLGLGGPSGTWIDLALDTSSLDPKVGKIVVATRLAATGLPDVVARYNTNGRLDTSFAGGAGYETLGNLTGIPLVAIQADGRIILAGNQGGGGPVELGRLNTDGSFDATFGSGGIVTVNSPNGYSAQDVTIASDGKILVAGLAPNTNTGQGESFFVARLNSADGSLDTGFGAGGVAVASGINVFGTVGMALEPDGSIVLAASQVTSSGGGALARFLA